MKEWEHYEAFKKLYFSNCFETCFWSEMEKKMIDNRLKETDEIKIT